MISSNACSLTDALKQGTFRPAKIQRDYQWELEQTKRLFDDLQTAFKRMNLDPGPTAIVDDEAPLDEDDARPATPQRRVAVGQRKDMLPDTYFLGAIILQHPEKSQNFAIYDGLQRLTTLNIMLAAMRDSWPDLAGTPDENAITQLLKTPNGQRRLIFPTHHETLASLVNKTKLQSGELGEGDQRMRATAGYFAGEFDSRWSAERRRAFLKFIETRVHVTVTTTHNHTVAYQMFVGANARGLRLAIGDVLKGMFAEDVREGDGKVQGTVAQIDACAKVWREAQADLRDDFDDFIHAVEAYKFRPPPPPAGQKRPSFIEDHTTGEQLKELFPEGTPAQTICDWVCGEFKDMAEVFSWTRRPVAIPRSEMVRGVDAALMRLSFLSWKEWQPLLLALGLRYRSPDNTEFVARLHQMVRACYIIDVLDWPAGTRRRQFLDAIEQVDAGQEAFAGNGRGRKRGALDFTSDDKRNARDVVKRRLRTPFAADAPRRSMMLWLETLHWGDEFPKACVTGASVEHILPKGGGLEWSKLFNPDERETKLHALGNLCLLEWRDNKKIGNDGWSTKAPVYESWRKRFKTLNRVLETSAVSISLTPPRPWCAGNVDQLTNERAELAEKVLGI